MNFSIGIENKLYQPNHSAQLLIFHIFMSFTIFLSLSLNSWSIYLTHKIRKKISADHIKTQIFLINILFTLIAMPYYILRETRHLKSNFLCKFLYSVTDFIMFVYNNLLILMAVDRFLFICTSIRLDLKRFFRIFYTITIIISSSSLARLLMNDCYEIILDNFVPNCSRYADQEAFFCFREHVIYIYNYFILLVISVNWFLTTFLYLILIRYVYKKTIIGKSYNFSLQSTKKRKSEFKILNQQNAPKIRNKIFRSSKHWEITKTFIKILVIFSIMRIPWFLSYFSLISFNPNIYYSFCCELIISPLMNISLSQTKRRTAQNSK